MSQHLKGIGASPGRAIGRARLLEWDIPRVEHRTIEPAEVDRELARFREALSAAAQQIIALRDETETRIGPIEAQILELQLLMLQDPELIEGSEAYIRDNYLSADRAFDWRMFEIRSQFLDTAHAMVVDRLADLRDVRCRVLSRLLGRSGSCVPESGDDRPHLIVSYELTPSLIVGLDPKRVLGLVTGGGSRGSHIAILARSLGLPCVVGLGRAVEEVRDGALVACDGRTGTLIVDPTPGEVEEFEAISIRISARRERLGKLQGQPTVSRDGRRVRLLANLDRPEDAHDALEAGAEGVGLFRTEFLVIAHPTIPTEEEQYAAYREVVKAFPDSEVVLRTFDVGGDKFPLFLEMPQEENPYLGWRAIRVCLDLPDLFRNQLGAALRAARHGDVRILLPFVVSVEEVEATRALLEEVRATHGIDPTQARIPLGVMVETPAALETADLLAPRVDFFSLGTNDLTQYTLAADRGNPRLATLYDPLHPALVRMYRRLIVTAEEYDTPVSVCSEVATDPAGLCVLLGLGYDTFSLPPYTIPEIKELVGSVSIAELEDICERLDDRSHPAEIRDPILRYLSETLSDAGVAG